MLSMLEPFLPQLLLVVFALMMPALDYIFKDKRILAAVALAPLVGYAVMLVAWTLAGVWEPPESEMSLIEVDLFSGLFALAFVSVGIIVVLGSPESIRQERNHGEYYALILLAVIGMTVVALSTDLILLFVGLEVAGIASFALSGFSKREKRSAEAATKYFIVGGFSSALTLFAISLFYGVSGTTAIADMGPAMEAMFSSFDGMDSVGTLATVMILAGLGFKVAIVPFHMWAPDVYEGSPTPISALLAAASKNMGFAALFKIFLLGLLVTKADWDVAVAVVAIITMTVGNLIAVSQTNIKRMLAYSSVAQAGYILMVLPIGTEYALAGGLFHVLTHAFMKSGAFMVVSAMGVRGVGESLNDFKGLRTRSPLLALAMTLLLLSLAGIPPLAGFASKFVLFSSAVYGSLDPGPSWLIWLAVAGVLNSALSLYYYARVIKYMYMEKGPEDRISVPRLTGVAILFAVVMTVVLGVYFDAVVELCQQAAGGLFNP
ncbi:MAG: NADH-quinone oxidoreductase subunit N [Candidatus Thermoplasmatota archaeon]|nr:NADH-quinone oxidoreductase subunit N [Candidatus Thermoplasmatota archaeon]